MHATTTTPAPDAPTRPVAAIDVDWITDILRPGRGNHLVHTGAGPGYDGRTTALCWTDATARMHAPRARQINAGQPLPAGICPTCLDVAAGGPTPPYPKCTRPSCADLPPHAGAA